MMIPHVLIIGSNSAVSSAFAAVQGCGWHPVLADPYEHPLQAVERTQPAYLLLDVSHPAAQEQAFYAAVTRIGTRVVLTGTNATTLLMRRLAVRFGVATIDVPLDEAEFSSAVEHRLDVEEWRAGWLSTRRLVGVGTGLPQGIHEVF